ncbi:MAG: GTPase HflX [Candidatus Raymondbacteria bacterium RifOxyA12_full_50_37]|uniref:GTPase HflX n=1 Tax=Candidatus Raymondbacteria bacterium RIFOXYD12_FULL_49_13 TaxID=1817890 RepID=A0A1F7F7Y4_UNCRA|nr:MAG: GTPase HflX [Candidatus Raymondbacteria bacterium RifOxyA12_full_50_37]OGJ94358.1 MAG: GTPase HflX [Candidatus Raymondbacteria bacterium RIFOXYA2_FULL_49_16]OGJ95300.1 MAG: GTPase HflX [Candidatus Raymondbacteria bacterium RIFOXYC2_FULL_50_21]OGJ99813.1 MAG: GTPase HflX [Candidatus Raymondbacteria bacterium RifOxyC12_full_50_8]OGK02775.1 MAG: GTPase HflX [Candidatus Raymondbacteria bacterium RIFOXYD12_FULL_49_13]OGP39542.1 MAG: GTPase HflX [Candidatus Raymondbacteria bacterium RIFOXYB2
MHEIQKEQQQWDRAILVGVGYGNDTPQVLAEHIEELALLADTARAIVAGTVTQMRQSPDSAHYVGKGKAEEIKLLVQELKIDVVIFDSDLSPRQLRNLEKICETKVIDRSMLILDIFAQHARTHEAKVQVGLAQLAYLSPRLSHMWSHLGQQAGGHGTRRGPGEKQIEIDRRLIKTRMAELRKELKDIEQQRSQQKQNRGAIFKACIVGYTNVGKSTILNAASKASVLVQNKLFATLDATTRRVYIQDHGEILLSDTVGFIRKLPHHLVASFRSTLEVITDADLIVIVIDASSPCYQDHSTVVNTVLNELKTTHIPRLLVFNKIDLVQEPKFLERLQNEFPNACFTAASKKEGIDGFKAALGMFARAWKGERTGEPHE